MTNVQCPMSNVQCPMSNVAVGDTQPQHAGFSPMSRDGGDSRAVGTPERSVPKVSLVEIDLVFHQKFPELILK